MKYEKGFSLLELIIVVGILAILASLTTMLGVGYFRSASLDQGAGEIILQLRKAQAKAMSGENGLRWGIHFVNPVSGAHYYQLFSTASDFSAGQIQEMIYLDERVNFSQPSSGNTLDVVFLKNTGKVAADVSVAVFLTSDTANIRTITVSREGRISE